MNKGETSKNSKGEGQSTNEIRNKEKQGKIKDTMNSPTSTEALVKAIKSLMNKDED